MLKLTEDEARGLDAIYKGIGILALVLGGAWTLAQYFVHRAEERETRPRLRPENLFWKSDYRFMTSWCFRPR